MRMLNPINHKSILIQILRKIYSDPTVGPKLGFKGGTAAMMFYGLPRFSVDLDFDLLDPKAEDMIMTAIPGIVQKIGEVKEAVKKKYTLLFVLRYEKGQRLVKIEISRRPLRVDSYETKNYLGVPMLVMNRSDMVSAKIAALLTRKKFASRDVFDVWYFLDRQWEMSEGRLRMETGFSKKTAFEKSIVMVERIPSELLMPGLGELIDNKMKHWVKDKLKDELLFLLRLKLSEF